MAVIGDVTEMYLVTTNQLGNTYKTKIGGNFQINPEKTYQEIDTAQRALAGLSSNVYQDTILITSISVNNVLADE